MLQLVEPRQSMGVSQPPAGQVILQAIPIGQVMGPGAGRAARAAGERADAVRAGAAARHAVRAGDVGVGRPAGARRRPGVGRTGATGAPPADPGDPASSANSAAPAYSPRAGRATGRGAPRSRGIARGISTVTASTARRVTARATLSRQRLAAAATSAAARRREAARAVQHGRARAARRRDDGGQPGSVHPAPHSEERHQDRHEQRGEPRTCLQCSPFL